MMRIHHPALAGANGAPPPMLFPRVVAAIDFSPASLAGCRWALAFLARGAEALFAHVVPFEQRPRITQGEQAAMPAPEGSAQTTPALSGGLGGFAATLDIVRARTAVRTGRPSAWLGRLAEEFDASLIVVGRRVDAKRRRVGEANVVARLARRTPLPVLVVPEGVVDAPGCVVAAVDEGPDGAAVIEAAAAIARAHESRLIVLHVLPPSSGAYDRVIGDGRGRRGLLPLGRRREATTLVVDRDAAWLSALMSGRGMHDARVVLGVGDAAREIVATGVAHGGALVVIGKRGSDHAPVGSLGSVARELLASSPLPVLALDARPSDVGP